MSHFFQHFVFYARAPAYIVVYLPARVGVSLQYLSLVDHQGIFGENI
jgi:hypothetical protein